jgi:hypothetical protein
MRSKNLSYDEYISGKFDSNETESTGRNDKTTFEFYGLGYVDKSGKIRVTKTGYLVSEDKIAEDLLIKQLLKIRFPSPAIHKKSNKEEYVFPMEVVLKCFTQFDSLNKFELGFLFMCNKIDKIDNLIDAIKEFKKRYNNIDNKLETKEVVKIFKDIKKKKFPLVKNKPETYYKEYSDALIRTLEYTGLFSQRGRGNYVKLFVPEHAKIKVKLLKEKYKFEYYEEKNFEEYMEWFGNPYNISLPWENKENIHTIIEDKINIFNYRLKEAEKNISNFEYKEKAKKISDLFKIDKEDENEKLKIIDNELSQQLISLNEELFINYHSKTQEGREEIIEKFIDIEEGNEDMAALWMECNTWKSLIAINGSHRVKRNFKIEDDLTPKAFAPGTGNTPDMELYKNGYIIIPEVSLMRGVQQWEHEGSSVIDHVYRFINQFEDKQILGLFISSSMNIRTIWQFFILNRESWIGKPVPVIPLTIKQYVEVIAFLYDKNLSIDDFKELIETIHIKTFEYEKFVDWENSIGNIINYWKQLKVS